MRKDRYSALVMANGAARLLRSVDPEPEYRSTGGFAKSGKATGPNWYRKGMALLNFSGKSVKRKEVSIALK